MSLKRTVARSLAVLALCTGAVAAISGPAAAAPDCYIIKYIGAGGGGIYAENEIFCESTMESEPRYNEIRRQNPDGTSTLLVSGMGWIEYTCVGTATNTYVTNGSSLPRDRVRTVTANCG